jgi:hypothetical protein
LSPVGALDETTVFQHSEPEQLDAYGARSVALAVILTSETKHVVLIHGTWGRGDPATTPLVVPLTGAEETSLYAVTSSSATVSYFFVS